MQCDSHFEYIFIIHTFYLITLSGTVRFFPILDNSSSPKSIGSHVYLSIKQTSSNGILTDTRRLRQTPSLDVAGLPLCSALQRWKSKNEFNIVRRLFHDNALNDKKFIPPLFKYNNECDSLPEEPVSWKENKYENY